jgi:hypothetical protein
MTAPSNLLLLLLLLLLLFGFISFYAWLKKKAGGSLVFLPL